VWIIASRVRPAVAHSSATDRRRPAGDRHPPLAPSATRPRRRDPIRARANPGSLDRVPRRVADAATYGVRGEHEEPVGTDGSTEARRVDAEEHVGGERALFTPAFANTDFRWSCTVYGDRLSDEAISFVDRPRNTSVTTAASRPVSPSAAPMRDVTSGGAAGSIVTTARPGPSGAPRGSSWGRLDHSVAFEHQYGETAGRRNTRRAEQGATADPRHVEPHRPRCHRPRPVGRLLPRPPRRRGRRGPRPSTHVPAPARLRAARRRRPASAGGGRLTVAPLTSTELEVLV
jgi:hypothetical protein